MPLTRQNVFLNLLGEDLRNEILKQCESVSLPARTVLYGPQETQPSAYFFTSGVATVVTLMPDGSTTEVGIMGREGFVGSVHLLGSETGASRSFMQIGGHAFKIPLPALRTIFRQSEEFRDRTLVHVQANILSLRQLTACNRLHTTEARLARWLLMVQDRIGSNTLQIKQQSLAEMLGSRRTTVTVAAATMKRNGWIAYSRGRIHILNRPQLEAAACICYPIVHQLFQNLCEPHAAPALRDAAPGTIRPTAA